MNRRRFLGASALSTAYAQTSGQIAHAMTSIQITSLSEALDDAFRASLLFTGRADLAEAAVLQGIANLDERDTAATELVATTIASLVRQPLGGVTPSDPRVAHLPRELQRLLWLAPVPRACFILRILFRISPENCAAALSLTIERFEESLRAALRHLPAAGPIQTSKGECS